MKRGDKVCVTLELCVTAKLVNPSSWGTREIPPEGPEWQIVGLELEDLDVWEALKDVKADAMWALMHDRLDDKEGAWA